MNQKKIIKEYDGIGRIDSCNLPDVEVRFCQYSNGEIKGKIRNINDRRVEEFWNSMKDFPPLTIEGNTSSGDLFVFHSFFVAHPTTELVGKDFEVVKIGVVEDNREYDFKIEFGILQLALYQNQQIRCDSPFGKFIISPVKNSSEILKEIKASKIFDVTSHISFTFSSSKENLEKNISKIVVYLESVMILLSFAQGVFINYICYNLYIKDEGFKLYKSVHRSAKTNGNTPDELIWTPHIQNFLVSVLPIFTEKDFQKQTGVGDAIEWYLESIRPSVIESKFIHACIAIELLNDRFKKNNNKNSIVTAKQFKKLKEDVEIAISNHIEPLDIGCLFSWDNVPGNDSDRVLEYLMNERDIDWVKSAEIFKSNDSKTIHILKDDNSVEIMIDKNEKKVTLKISDGRIYDLEVKKENDKLKIYDLSKCEEICRKIPELNRPTLKSSLRDMYYSYGINYSDLFPDFEFVRIRDNIVHTGISNSDSNDFFENYEKMVALLHRTLLGMLNYSGEFIDRLDNWKHKKFKKKIN
ncbi:MAG: hypothetical protein MIO93_02020 [ANME-2 cluster archaeon]|nr:hypothetical protein [ANME-2 cluster archaeon]